MRENGEKVKEKDMENFTIRAELNMRESSKIMKFKAREYNIIIMDKDLKGNGKMVRDQEEYIIT